MEVDNKGKTQAIYPNHDDQVFSYLMAIYVWYDGKNLAENYGIQKNLLKTDQDEEVLDSDIEMNETVERIPLETVDNEIEDALEEQKPFLKEASKYSSRKDFEQSQYEEEQELFNQFLLLNKDAKQAYEEKYNIQSVENQIINGIQYIKIPDSMFGNIDPDSSEELDREKKLHGNLYHMFTQV